MLWKPTLALALLPVGAFGAWWCAGGAPCRSVAASGVYVEARSASVFAGACHYNGEYTTQGRELVLGFRLGDVREGGVDLQGVELVVAVAGDRNLEEPQAHRRSVVYLDAELDGPRAQAALAWLEREHASILGERLAVRRGDVRVSLDRGAYDVRALDAVRLAGAALAERACCSMPSNVWYEPEVALAERVVGHSSLLSIREPALGLDLARHGENNAFVGGLADSSARAGACCSSEMF